MINNVGLLHETLVARCALSLVDGRDRNAAEALRLERRFFAPSKPLNAELRLHLSLSRPRGLSEQSAQRLIASVREQAIALDRARIDEESAKCSKIVGNALNGQRISIPQDEFRRYMLVGKLVSAWRRGAEPGRIAQLESALVRDMLVERAAEPSPAAKLPVQPALLKRTMARRLQETYAGKLDSEQRTILTEACAGDQRKLLARSAAAASRIEARVRFDRELSDETRLKAAALSEALRSAVIADDALVAQLLACVDIERELDSEQ
jgi:hypothetical protein